MEAFEEATQEGKLTEIMEGDGDMTSRYWKWLVEINRIMDVVAEKRSVRKIRPLKITRRLGRSRRALKKRGDITPGQKRKQINTINEIIEQEIKRHRAMETMQRARCLQTENKMHSGTFWEFKKRMDRKGKGRNTVSNE